MSDDPTKINGQFAAAFANPAGQAVLDWLRAHTIDRELPPGATEAELRDLEGQRRLVRLMDKKIKAGQAGI